MEAAAQDEAVPFVRLRMPAVAKSVDGFLSNEREHMTTVENTDAAVLGKLLDERWSCRTFRPDPVPRDVIQRVLEMAGKSPSWCNTQPWYTLVTDGPGTERFRRA
jgi:nitroreductase family protein